MNLKRIILEFTTVFTFTLLVGIGVSFLWNIVSHGVAIIDREPSFRLALILGIFLPVVESRIGKRNIDAAIFCSDV